MKWAASWWSTRAQFYSACISACVTPARELKCFSGDPRLARQQKYIYSLHCNCSLWLFLRPACIASHNYIFSCVSTSRTGQHRVNHRFVLQNICVCIVKYSHSNSVQWDLDSNFPEVPLKNENINPYPPSPMSNMHSVAACRLFLSHQHQPAVVLGFCGGQEGFWKRDNSMYCRKKTVKLDCAKKKQHVEWSERKIYTIYWILTS